MNTILGVVFAVLMVILIIGYVKFYKATLVAYKRDQEFKDLILSFIQNRKRGRYLFVLWWYDKKDFTYLLTCGEDSSDATNRLFKLTTGKPNKDFAIVNIKKLD